MGEFAGRFEELEIWQLARELSNAFMDEMEDCPRYSFRDQIERAATSAMNNIAEGFERRRTLVTSLTSPKGLRAKSEVCST